MAQRRIPISRESRRVSGIEEKDGVKLNVRVRLLECIARGRKF
jgi:hypothetical protein